MGKIFNFFSKYKKIIFRASILFASVLFIVNFYPYQGKFKYEFQKGRPWQHDDLIAPFDFAVYKLDSEIKEETDSIKNNSYPYFRYDAKIKNNMLSELRIYLDNQLKTYDETYLKSKKMTKRKQEKIREELEKYVTDIIDLYTDIYNRGILEPAEVLIKLKSPHSTVVVVRDKVAEEYKVSELYTLKSSYEKIQEYIDDESKFVSPGSVTSEFLHSFDINRFLKPNLFYDKITTEKVLESNLKSISYTRGMIQRGERIISRGELINTEKYRVLESLRKENERYSGMSFDRNMALWGYSIVVLTLMILLFLFLKYFRPTVFETYNGFLFIMLIETIFIISANVLVKFTSISLYAFPFVMMAILINIFFDERIALFANVIGIFIIAFVAPNSFEFVLIEFVASVSGIISLNQLQRRGQLFSASAVIFASISVVYFGLAIIQERNIESIKLINFVYFSINSVLLLLAYPLIYAFEKMFGFISDVTLLEISNTNQPLLRKLAQNAPGTFQHSIQVANLAEEAIYKIGGNPLLIRAGALYHDIGKLYSPFLFTENQVGDINPHNDMNCLESAEKIIEHVKKGKEIAEQNRLPKQVIDFILTHHGTSKTQYFLRTFKAKNPDTIIDENAFRYPGPKPFSKETAVLMMADSVEAASRSLKDYSIDNLSKLVNNIINFQINESQFSDSNLTFKDIEIIKETFIEKLLNIYHKRVAYPKAK